MHRISIVLFSVLVSCGGSSEDSGADPIAPRAEDGLITFATVSVIANGGSERGVELDFRDLGCTRSVVAGCVVNDCGLIGASPTTTPTPGKVVVSSATLGNVELAVDAAGYARTFQSGPLPSGETVSFKIAGDALPAFDSDLVTPAPPSGMTVGGCAAGSRTQCALQLDKDPFVTWSGGTDTLRVALRFASGDRETRVVCTYPSSAHAGRLPAEVAARLPKGASGTVAFATEVSKTTDAGSHRTTISAVSLPMGFSASVTTP